jgi:hypothetical protein
VMVLVVVVVLVMLLVGPHSPPAVKDLQEVFVSANAGPARRDAIITRVEERMFPKFLFKNRTSVYLQTTTSDGRSERREKDFHCGDGNEVGERDI